MMVLRIILSMSIRSLKKEDYLLSFVPAEALEDNIVFHSHKIQFILANACEKDVVDLIFKFFLLVLQSLN